MRNRNFPWAIIAAAAVAGAGFAGVANYVRHQDKVPAEFLKDDANSRTIIGKDALSGDQGKNKGSNSAEDNNGDHQVVKGASKVEALNKAIKDKTYDQKGIRVLDVSVEDGNAIVDMNNPVRFNWGSEEEADFINLMKDTLGKFESVKTFQIRVDGEILKSLSHFEIDRVKVR